MAPTPALHEYTSRLARRAGSGISQAPRRLGPFIQAALLAALTSCGSPQVGSVGAVLGVNGETGSVIVREVRDGRAADKAGLQPGDEILMIDGVYTRDLGAATVRQKLRGAPGTSVDLTVVRGEAVLRLTLVRTPLDTPLQAPPPKEERIAP